MEMFSMKGDAETSRATARARFSDTPSSPPCHGQQWDARPGLLEMHVRLFVLPPFEVKTRFLVSQQVSWITVASVTQLSWDWGKQNQTGLHVKEEKARAGFSKLRRRPRCRQQQYPVLSLTAKYALWTLNLYSAAPRTVFGAGRRRSTVLMWVTLMPRPHVKRGI